VALKLLEEGVEADHLGLQFSPAAAEEPVEVEFFRFQARNTASFLATVTRIFATSAACELSLVA
jgi:hypothetical protein